MEQSPYRPHLHCPLCDRRVPRRELEQHLRAEHCFTALRELDTYDDLRPLAGRLGPALQRLIERSPRTVDAEARHRLTDEARRLRARADDFMLGQPLLILHGHVFDDFRISELADGTEVAASPYVSEG